MKLMGIYNSILLSEVQHQPEYATTANMTFYLDTRSSILKLSRELLMSLSFRY